MVGLASMYQAILVGWSRSVAGAETTTCDIRAQSGVSVESCIHRASVLFISSQECAVVHQSLQSVLQFVREPGSDCVYEVTLVTR